MLTCSIFLSRHDATRRVITVSSRLLSCRLISLETLAKHQSVSEQRQPACFRRHPLVAECGGRHKDVMRF